MMEVIIRINKRVIYQHHVVRQQKVPEDGKCTYLLDSGQIIEHNYADGAAILAKKMLDHAELLVGNEKIESRRN